MFWYRRRLLSFFKHKKKTRLNLATEQEENCNHDYNMFIATVTVSRAAYVTWRLFFFPERKFVPTFLNDSFELVVAILVNWDIVISVLYMIANVLFFQMPPERCKFYQKVNDFRWFSLSEQKFFQSSTTFDDCRKSYFQLTKTCRMYIFQKCFLCMLNYNLYVFCNKYLNSNFRLRHKSSFTVAAQV